MTISSKYWFISLKSTPISRQLTELENIFVLQVQKKKKIFSSNVNSVRLTFICFSDFAVHKLIFTWKPETC